MMSHGPTYDLATPKSRLVGKKKMPTAPMPPSRVRLDWVGESREDLLKKKDFLPDGVRACPRAFVVDPGCSNTRAKGSEWVAGHREELPQPLSQNSSLPPPIPRPTVPTMPWQIIEHQHSRPSSGPIVAVHIEYLDGTFLRLPRDLSPQPPMVQPRFQQPLPPHSAVKRSYNTV
jgi:hypothetical protein